MKLSFFAALMLAINTSAVRMYSMPETDEYMDDFAEIDSHAHGKMKSAGDVAAAAEAAVASAADQIIRVNIPECQQGPKAEQLILQAVDDLSTKANELKEAMEINCKAKTACPAPVAIAAPACGAPCGAPCGQQVVVARPAVGGCGVGCHAGCGSIVNAAPVAAVSGCATGCGVQGIPAMLGAGGVPVLSVCQGCPKKEEEKKE